MSGFNLFSVGDEIGYRRRQDLLLGGTNTVVGSELLDAMTVRLTLKDELPEDLSGLVVENRTRMPDQTIIRNNTFIECAGRESREFTPGTGIINFNLETHTVVPGCFPHRNVRIESNRFVNHTVSAAAIRARGVSGLTIRGNTFECDVASPRLATLFGCGEVRFVDNRIATADGEGTIHTGQMKVSEIHHAPDAGWRIETAR